MYKDMEQTLLIYNTLSRTKERFVPASPGSVGMYVCGPTVYGDPHLGHARPAITFDIVARYLRHLGYKVRYVRNITDVGHLEHDADEGDDKIAKRARVEQTEPMEIAQHYANRYHDAMRAIGCLPPSVEPAASGHIIEQQSLVQAILDHGYAYVAGGSVYFDIARYNQDHKYGVLSGRNLTDIINASRQLDGTGDKRHPADFALWKRAQPEHIMRWPSPWGEGFPGWHCECTAMGRKYLGESIDIHGGGMDLIFPHHECEIAQAVAAYGHPIVRYWMHNNMITINGQKMGKSIGNFITLEQFFTGSHPLLEKAYSPMTIRFFIVAAHYRGPLDFSNAALQASEKGLHRLMAAIDETARLTPAEHSDDATHALVTTLRSRCYAAMNDDFATPQVVSALFDACNTVNRLLSGQGTISAADRDELRGAMTLFARDILGLRGESAATATARENAYERAVDALLALRDKARQAKDWATCDAIRRTLADAGFEVKDTKNGTTWRLNIK